MIRLTDVVTKDGCNLLGIDLAAVVFIEETEGSPHVIVIEHLVLVCRRCAPLTKIDLSVPVDVCLVKDFTRNLIDSLWGRIWVQETVSCQELLPFDLSIVVLVELLEGVTHDLHLVLRRQVRRYECQSCLLKLSLTLSNATKNRVLVDSRFRSNAVICAQD